MSTVNLSNGNMATTQSIPLQTLGGQTADAQPAPSPVQSQDRGSPPVELDYWRRQYHRMKWVETETRANMPLLDFENLQHLNLFHLDSTSRDIQDDMDKSKITTESQCKLLRETLHNYGQLLPLLSPWKRGAHRQCRSAEIDPQKPPPSAITNTCSSFPGTVGERVPSFSISLDRSQTSKPPMQSESSCGKGFPYACLIPERNLARISRTIIGETPR